MKKELQFTFEEVVKVSDTRKPPLFSNGLVDAVKETKGYCLIDDDGEIDYMTIDSVAIVNNDGSRQVGFSDEDEDDNTGLVKKVIERFRFITGKVK